MNLATLSAAGFDVASLNHAEAVMVRDFSKPLGELCDVLTHMQVLDSELVRGGGGESSVTQRLRQAFTERGWKKRKMVIRKTVDGRERAATTHQIDHVRETKLGSVALEIEWNNKDPFYDRDLENSSGYTLKEQSALASFLRVAGHCSNRCAISCLNLRSSEISRVFTIWPRSVSRQQRGNRE